MDPRSEHILDDECFRCDHSGLRSVRAMCLCCGRKGDVHLKAWLSVLRFAILCWFVRRMALAILRVSIRVIL